MIELKHIDIGFAQKQCITDGSFCARDGQITVICGESGTGKSALLNLIAMLDQKNTCEYMYQGKLLQLSALEKERFRNQHMSYITQHALLFAHNTVLDNLKFYLRDDDADNRAEELLQMAGLIEERKKCVRLLSGGERQRLAVLCALAADREIILGDEITAALDQENKAIVRRLMRQCAEEGKTVILLDDMVDTAGSLCGAAKALIEVGGAKEIYACATHGVLSRPALERIEESPIKELKLCDTIPYPVGEPRLEKINYVSVDRLFAEAIRRIYEEVSISPLFE